MARIRTIKPDFWIDEDIAGCSPLAQLLYIGLWNFSDDEGRGQYVPLRIHGNIFPYREDVDIRALLGELEAGGFIRVYQVSGQRYYDIPTFAKHQKIDKRQDSRLPAFSEGFGEPPPKGRGNPPKDSALERDQGKGSGNREEDTGAVAPPLSGPSLSSDVDQPDDSVGDDGDDEPTPQQESPTPAGEPRAVKKVPAADQTWGDFFESDVWPARPRRSGTDSHKKGLAAFVAVLRNNHARGVTPELLREKHQEYRIWCEATNKIRTERVMCVSSFFGEKEGWRQDWDPPAEIIQHPSAGGRGRVANSLSGLARWVAEDEARKGDVIEVQAQ
mgnify:CR=1 FL=1